MDLIDRQDALEAICTWDKFGVDGRGRVVRWHEGLEPRVVRWHEGLEPYVHLRDVVWAIEKMPSVKPERIGFWRLSTPFVDTVECSLCGYQWPEPAMASKYCPDCGALMFKEVEKIPEEEEGENDSQT